MVRPLRYNNITAAILPCSFLELSNKFLSRGAGLVNDLFEKCGFSGDDIYGMDSTSMKSLIGIGKGDYHGLGFDKVM